MQTHIKEGRKGKEHEDYEGVKVVAWTNEEERRLPRKRDTLLPLERPSSTSILREGLRTSLFQRLGGAEGEVERGDGAAVKDCDDAGRCCCLMPLV